MEPVHIETLIPPSPPMSSLLFCISISGQASLLVAQDPNLGGIFTSFLCLPSHVQSIRRLCGFDLWKISLVQPLPATSTVAPAPAPTPIQTIGSHTCFLQWPPHCLSPPALAPHPALLALLQQSEGCASPLLETLRSFIEFSSHSE